MNEISQIAKKGFYEFNLDINNSFGNSIIEEFFVEKNIKDNHKVLAISKSSKEISRSMRLGKPFVIERGFYGYNHSFYDYWFANKKYDFVENIINLNAYKKITEVALKDYYINNVNLYISMSDLKTREYHRDCNSSMRQLKIFTYLTDVLSVENGPYSYIEKNSSEKRTFIGNAGFSLVSVQYGLHAGLPQEDGFFRVVLVTNMIKK